MKNWHSSYWTLFNTLGRIGGVLFFIGGLIMGAFGLVSLRNKQDDAWLVIIVSSVVDVLGILLVIAKPYRPKNGEHLK